MNKDDLIDAIAGDGQQGDASDVDLTPTQKMANEAVLWPVI